MSNRKIRLPSTRIRGNDSDNPSTREYEVYQMNSSAHSRLLNYAIFIRLATIPSYFHSDLPVLQIVLFGPLRSSFTTGASFITRINAVKLFSRYDENKNLKYFDVDRRTCQCGRHVSRWSKYSCDTMYGRYH